MNKKKLILARKKIDKLDNKIFDLIKKRTRVVEYMISIKNLKKQIIDHERINEVLKNIRKKSVKNKIDPKITNRIWKSIIWSYVNFQKKNFKRK